MPVRDNVATAEEVMVVDARPVQGTLHYAKCVSVIIDSLDDRRLVFDHNPAASCNTLDGLPGVRMPHE